MFFFYNCKTTAYCVYIQSNVEAVLEIGEIYVLRTNRYREFSSKFTSGLKPFRAPIPPSVIKLRNPLLFSSVQNTTEEFHAIFIISFFRLVQSFPPPGLFPRGFSAFCVFCQIILTRIPLLHIATGMTVFYLVLSLPAIIVLGPNQLSGDIGIGYFILWKTREGEKKILHVLYQCNLIC